VTKIRLYIVGGIMGEMSMEHKRSDTDGKTETLEKKNCSQFDVSATNSTRP